MTLWKGFRGSSTDYESFRFSVNQRNHSLSINRQQRVELRGLYFKLGDWILLKTLAALPCLARDLLLYLLYYANIAWEGPL